MHAQLIVKQRLDSTRGWVLLSPDGGETIATDGSQGYFDASTARDMADKVLAGHYANAYRKIIRRP